MQKQGIVQCANNADLNKILKRSQKSGDIHTEQGNKFITVMNSCLTLTWYFGNFL